MVQYAYSFHRHCMIVEKKFICISHDSHVCLVKVSRAPQPSYEIPVTFGGKWQNSRVQTNLLTLCLHHFSFWLDWINETTLYQNCTTTLHFLYQQESLYRTVLPHGYWSYVEACHTEKSEVPFDAAVISFMWVKSTEYVYAEVVFICCYSLYFAVHLYYPGPEIYFGIKLKSISEDIIRSRRPCSTRETR